MAHLYPHFLANDTEYAQAQAEWAKVWDAIPEPDRASFGWRAGWFILQSPNDGNPIFTAISETQRKAIRVIQYAPTTTGMEIDFWIDSYGGSAIEPIAIRELVIACALSDESAHRAFELMSSWVVGDIEISREQGGVANIHRLATRWQAPIPNELPASN